MKSWSTFFTKTPNKKDKWMSETLQATQTFRGSGGGILKSDGPQSSVGSSFRRKEAVWIRPLLSVLKTHRLTAEMGIPSGVWGWVWKAPFMPDLRGAPHGFRCSRLGAASAARSTSSKNWPEVLLVFMHTLSTFKLTIFHSKSVFTLTWKCCWFSKFLSKKPNSIDKRGKHSKG